MSRLGLFWTKRDIFGAWVRFKSCSGVYSYVLTSPTVYWIHKSPLSKLFEIFWRQTNRQTDGHTKPPLKITCHRLKSVFDLNLVIKLSFVHLLGLSDNSYHSGFFLRKQIMILNIWSNNNFNYPVVVIRNEYWGPDIRNRIRFLITPIRLTSTRRAHMRIVISTGLTIPFCLRYRPY